MKFFCGEQWEAIGEVKAHLMSEDAFRAGAGAVGFDCALVEYLLQQVEILFHCGVFFDFFFGKGLVHRHPSRQREQP